MTNPLYFPVLDHGFVALVDWMGGDHDIEQAARVSYGKGTRKVSETRGLIHYLMRHRHTTPFEMVELKFHCAMPLFVARQWIRHRTANINEYSGRYSVMPDVLYLPPEERFGGQDRVNRQGTDTEKEPELDYTTFRDDLYLTGANALASYETYLERGVARELARVGLPLNCYTEWYWKIDLHNLFHFLELRLDSHAQWEIRQYARMIASLVREVAPLAFEAFLDYRVHAVTMSRQVALTYFYGEDKDKLPRREQEEHDAQVAAISNATWPRDYELDPLDGISPEKARKRLHGEEE